MNIDNIEYLEKVLKENKINFYQLYDFIDKIECNKQFYNDRRFEGMYPHALLKPCQSGIDLQGICIETGDNSIDAGCNNLLYKFIENTDGTIDAMVIDDGNGIKNHDIKKAVAYGGYFGKRNANNSGKFLEGLSNACGGFSEVTEIYTSNGEGWYKYIIEFGELKKMISIYEENFNKLEGDKRDIYQGLAYKYMLDKYMYDPIKIEDNVIKKFSENNKGTIIIFRKCLSDIISSSSLNESAENLKDILGRRYWRKIDSGLNIAIYVKYKDTEERRLDVKSIDIMLRTKKCNYRNALITKFFELDKYFKVSDFTHNANDKDYLSLNVSIKSKTSLYATKIPQKTTKDNLQKVKVPDVLRVGVEQQGLTIERNGLPIIDYARCGLSIHPSYNGISIELCVDSRLDTAFFVNGDKSGLSQRKLERALKDTIDNILRQAYNIKMNKKESITYIDATGATVEKYPVVIKPDFLEQPNTEKVEIPEEKEPRTEKVSGNNEFNKKSKNNPLGLKDKSPKEPITIDKTDIDMNKKSTSGLAFAVIYKTDCRYDADKKEMLYDINDENYLIFDDVINYEQGVRIKDLKKWWTKKSNSKMTLEERMKKSIPSKAKFQERIYNIYKNHIEGVLRDNAPALFVEVELYRNSYTNKQRPNSEPQRFDFCFILPKNKKILIEIDGIQHIAEPQGKLWIASEEKYSRQCDFDREWQLKGNEIYRISNYSLNNMSEGEFNIFTRLVQ